MRKTTVGKVKEVQILHFWSKNISCTLKIGAIGCAETVVQNYNSTLRNIKEEGGLQTQFCTH
jgi:hypothetical protein